MQQLKVSHWLNGKAKALVCQCASAASLMGSTASWNITLLVDSRLGDFASVAEDSDAFRSDNALRSMKLTLAAITPLSLDRTHFRRCRRKQSPNRPVKPSENAKC